MKKQFLSLTALLGLAIALAWSGCQKEASLIQDDPAIEARTTGDSAAFTWSGGQREDDPVIGARPSGDSAALTWSGYQNGHIQNDPAIGARPSGDSKVFPPTAHPYGKSYPEWTQVWLEKFNTYDCETVPWYNPENVLFHTTGPVFFLAGIAEAGGSADITVPHGKALLFPLVNVWLNYPCPEFWGWEPPAGVSIGDWLTGEVGNALTNVEVSSLSVTIDGNEVSNLGSYKFVSDPFDCEVNPDLVNCADPCATGDPQPTVMGGYYVMLKSLPKGQHTVHYHMEAPNWGAVQDGTFNITVI